MFLIVPLLLFAAAIWIRRSTRSLPERSSGWAGGVLLLALATAAVLPHVPLSGGNWDSVSRTVPLLATAVSLLLNYAGGARSPSVSLLWEAGALCLASMSLHPLWQWLAVQLAIVPLIAGRDEPDSSRKDFRFRDALVASMLFGAGMLGWNLAAGEVWRMVSLILILCGHGGLFGWFPFPRAALLPGSERDDLSRAGIRVLADLTAGVFWLRLLERPGGIPTEGFLVASAAVFSLVQSSSRLWNEHQLCRRISLTSTITLGFLMIAAVFSDWATTHAERLPRDASLLPGASLFLAILFCETTALLVMICCHGLLNGTSITGGEDLSSVEGAWGTHPGATAGMLLGNCSLAGLPPLPGFWWRFSLLVACLIPHRQSSITRVIEPDEGFVLLLAVLAGVLILNAIGQLRLVQAVLFAEPVRMRGDSAPNRWKVATVCSLLMFGAVVRFPLARGGMPEVEKIPDPSTTSRSE